MTPKQTLKLLSTSLVLLVVALAAAIGPRFLRPDYDFNRQKRFVEEVRAGKREVSKERAIEILELQIRGVEAERTIVISVLGLIEYVGYFLIVLVVFQVWIVLQVRSNFDAASHVESR
jgi:hypothetical protein